jgi:hypothetical protein
MRFSELSKRISHAIQTEIIVKGNISCDSDLEKF